MVGQCLWHHGIACSKINEAKELLFDWDIRAQVAAHLHRGISCPLIEEEKHFFVKCFFVCA